MNKDNAHNLFRKIITSLVCIKLLTKSDIIKKEAQKYLIEVTQAYNVFVQSKNLSKINIKYLQQDIDAFSYECINDKTSDLVLHGEDLKYGFDELCKIIKNI